MEFINKTINKYAKCLFIPVLILLTLSVSGCSSLHGRFIELNFEQEDNNQPVRLSDHEVFFAVTMKYFLREDIQKVVK